MKDLHGLDRLAVLGAPPAFDAPLHVGRPNTGDRSALMVRINDLLDRRWLTNNGPFVQEFEQRIANLLGVKHCIAMCNATVALEIAIRALGLHGEVIVPSFTFVATAHALQWQGIRPVFCDIDPATHNLDPDKVENLITPRTTGILGVHLWGRPCAVEELSEIACRHRVQLLFDAAHALGCSHQGRMIGNFGQAEVFSFHATKVLNTAEGGAVTTHDDDLAARMRLMRNFGFAGYDEVVRLGTNGKMSEIAAALGLTGLESLGDFIATNQRNEASYRSGLRDIPGIHLISYRDMEHCNYQYVTIEVDKEATGIGRDVLMRVLHAENILVRRYFYPGCHRMEPYRSTPLYADTSLPETERLAQRIMSLPTGDTIGPREIEIICGIIGLVVKNGEQLTARLAAQDRRQR